MNQSPHEIDFLVEHLDRLKVDQLGSTAWLRQHERIEVLNMQAHSNLMQQRDEFVTESLISFQQMPSLIHDLLVHETWRRKVFPLVLPHLQQQSLMKAYTLLFHESSVLNLIEVAVFSKAACLGLGETLLDLVDYCSRQLLFLNQCEPSTDAVPTPMTLERAKAMATTTAPEELQDLLKPIEFGLAIHALAVLRSITDYIDEVPLNILHRILNTNDTITQLIYLLEKKPWQVQEGSLMKRFEEEQWRLLEGDQQLLVGRVEAQVWIALYNLLVDPACRKKYEYTQHRQDVVLRLRQHWTSTLIDQLPVLVHLQRTVEEVSILVTPSMTDSVKTGAMIEEVSELLDTIMTMQDWQGIATRQLETVFTGKDQKELMKSMASLYNVDCLEALLPDEPKCSQCGMTAVQRCSRCKLEWYCGRACQVKQWKVHKPLCDLTSAVNGIQQVESQSSGITAL